MTSILALDPGLPGAGRVLKELAKVAPKEVTYIPPGSGYPGALERPSFILLPAWNPQYVSAMRAPGNKVIICWTSPTLQSEMVPLEIEYMRDVLHFLDAGKIWGIWFGSEAWMGMVKKEGRRVFYSPYPVTLPEKVSAHEAKAKRIKYSSSVKQVSLFGPMHPRKNVLNQAIGAKVAGAFVHLTDETARPILELTGCPYQSHGWLPSEQYEKLLLETIEVGLQVSIPGCESFSFVAFDHISRGIPCLNALTWTPPSTRVAHDDPRKIAAAISDPYNPADMRRWAEDYAKKANATCLETLERELGISLR